MSAVVLSGGHVLGSSSRVFVVGASGGGGGTGSGNNLIFNYSSFNGSIVSTGGTAITLANGESSLAGTSIAMPNYGAQHQGGAAWYTTQVNISTFTTTFNFSVNSGGFTVVGSSQYASENGMTFCIQNSNVTTNPNGNYGVHAVGDANMNGYGNTGSDPFGTEPGNSIAVKFDSDSYGSEMYPAGAGHPSTVGLYINGGPNQALLAANDLNPYGINFYNGHSYNATITYDGTVLTLVLQDTTSNLQARYAWNVNITAATLGNMAWVGFTGGQFYETSQISNGAFQKINSWSFYDGSVGTYMRLAAPTFNIASGIYTTTQTVTINYPAGSTCYYTTNGLQPTSASTAYSGAITVSSSTVINAVAIQSGFTDSYVAQAAYSINAVSKTINFPSGFASASNLIILTGYSYFSGANLYLVDGSGTGGPSGNSGMAVGAAWYAAPVTISTFSTNFSFTFQIDNGANPYDRGRTFCIQNYTPPITSPSTYLLQTGGPLAIGNNQASFGYGPVVGGGSGNGGLTNSVAIAFNPGANSIGMYTNGATPSGSDTAVSGITLGSAHLITCAVTYNGATLTLVLTDTVTTATQTFNWTVNIPSVVGANTAYVGFTASNGYTYVDQIVNAWTL